MKNSEENKNSSLTMPQSVLIAGVLVAIAVIVGAVMVVRAVSVKKGDVASADPLQAQSAGGEQVNVHNVVLANEPYIGNSKPKAIVAYWCDYRSAACSNFEGSVLQSVLEKYVANGGDVAIVFKDNVTGGDASNLAALYGRAIWELYPSQYFVWRESMFEAKHTVGNSFGDDASILKLTSTIPGFDVAKVKATLAANRNTYQMIIDTDALEAKNFKITEEPGLITDTKLMQGATSYQKLSSAIDDQLK